MKIDESLIFPTCINAKKDDIREVGIRWAHFYEAQYLANQTRDKCSLHPSGAKIYGQDGMTEYSLLGGEEFEITSFKCGILKYATTEELQKNEDNEFIFRVKVTGHLDGPTISSYQKLDDYTFTYEIFVVPIDKTMSGVKAKYLIESNEVVPVGGKSSEHLGRTRGKVDSFIKWNDALGLDEFSHNYIFPIIYNTLNETFRSEKATPIASSTHPNFGTW